MKGKRGEGGGRKPRLTGEQKQELRGFLQTREFWATEEIRELIKEEFNTQYSQQQIRRILRDFGMILSKPYPQDYRRPAEAERILQERLAEEFGKLESKGIRREEIAIGFVDESSPQNRANTVRLWSFGKVRMKKNTDRMRINGIGFYALRGKDIIGFMDNSKAQNICKFLEELREANKEYRAVVVIIDNFKSHSSEIVRGKAEELGIHLVYLPSYSPDLNPIEQIWRVIKRVMSLAFVKNLEEGRKLVEDNFYKVVGKLSFARNWITNFFNPLWNSYGFSREVM